MGVDRGVSENDRIDKLVGREICIRIMRIVRAFRDDLRLHHVVDELVGILDMLGAGWNAPEIKPGGRAGLGNMI